MDWETTRPKMIASWCCHRTKISPELNPKPNHRPKQQIKRKDNHRGWCVPQRTRVVAPTEDKRTNQQTRTNNPDQTNTRTKIIQYHSNLGRISDYEPDCYNSCTLYRGLCSEPMHSDFITFQWLKNLHIAMPAKHNHTSFGVRSGDHYMSLHNFTPCSMTCLTKVSPQRSLLHC
jgi:hypothetical protein